MKQYKLCFSFLLIIGITIGCSSGGSDSTDETGDTNENQEHILTVQKSGEGNGTITSDTQGIICGNICEEEIANNTQVTLTATPDNGSVFIGWNGDIIIGNPVSTCQVTLNQAKTITGIFSIEQTATDLINPETDFEYLGAFRLPDEQGDDPDAKWNGGGHGMTYYPLGDTGGAADGYPGSLFSISHTYANHVSEFGIPAPVISSDKNLDDLPVAQTIQPFADVTAGRQTGGLTGSTLVDIQYLPKQGQQTTDKLYWTMYEYYMPQHADAFHGWAELDLSNLQSQGVWRLGDFPSSATSKYLFEIPASWAATYTPGKILAAGRYRIVNGGSWGPALYAFGPWNDGNPPNNESSVEATELLKYESDLILKDYSYNDNWDDGAWITIGSKSAVIFTGNKGFRTKADGLGTYGGPQPDDYSSSKGYHAGPDYAAMLFYDPTLIAEVTKGNLLPGEIQPYATFNLQDYIFTTNMDLPYQGMRTRGKTLGGAGYDRENNLLYVIEKNVEGYYSPGKPIVHVFKLKDNNQNPDMIPPGIPENLIAESTAFDQVSISWDPSSDNNHLAGYVIFRDNFPIDTITGTTYTDDRINPSSTYEYTILAWDSRNNRSLKSLPLMVTTPAGTDERIPLITNIRVTDITESTAVVSWNTDEPASSHIKYGAQYNTNMEINDDALITSHSMLLTGLTEAPSYGLYIYHITSTDAQGNINEYPGKNFKTLKSDADNFAPTLQGIGAKRIISESLLQFKLKGFDLDQDDTLSFSASDLPDGATFNDGTIIFQWQPTVNDIGIHHITFTVSDGDQTDHETIAIIVE